MLPCPGNTNSRSRSAIFTNQENEQEGSLEQAFEPFRSSNRVSYPFIGRLLLSP